MSFQVAVIEAKDIKAMDLGGTSDPFVVLEYGKQHFKTRVINKTLYPVWLEEITFAVEPSTPLSVALFDKDRISHDDKIEQLTIPETKLYDGKEHDEWVKLAKGELHLRWIFLPSTKPDKAPQMLTVTRSAYIQKKGKRTWKKKWAVIKDDFLVLSANDSPTSKPSIFPLKNTSISTGNEPDHPFIIKASRLKGKHTSTWQMSFESEELLKSWYAVLLAALSGQKKTQSQWHVSGVCFVTVVEAKDLLAKDSTGSSDPYVILHLGSDSKRTTTKPKTLNPSWDEIFEFDVNNSTAILTLIVMDEDIKTKADHIGRVTLPLKHYEDQQERVEWHNIVDLGSGQKVYGKINIKIRYVWDKPNPNASATRVFGVPLDQILASQSDKSIAIPSVVSAILAFLRKEGLDTEGIFRLSAASHQVKEMQVLADRGRYDFTQHQVIAAAALLKTFLRDMPDPLLTEELAPQWMALASEGHEDLAKLKALVAKLPKPNQDLLRELLLFLKELSTHEPKTKMNSKNLAICIAPNILRTSSSDINPLALIQNQVVVEAMIRHAGELF